MDNRTLAGNVGNGQGSQVRHEFDWSASPGASRQTTHAMGQDGRGIAANIAPAVEHDMAAVREPLPQIHATDGKAAGGANGIPCPQEDGRFYSDRSASRIQTSVDLSTRHQQPDGVQPSANFHFEDANQAHLNVGPTLSNTQIASSQRVLDCNASSGSEGDDLVDQVDSTQSSVVQHYPQHVVQSGGVTNTLPCNRGIVRMTNASPTDHNIRRMLPAALFHKLSAAVKHTQRTESGRIDINNEDVVLMALPHPESHRVLSTFVIKSAMEIWKLKSMDTTS
ncbi:hypothetical protein JX265_012897 [Neoarthrinium moseri]|uniref:Uncharacterized protein n=1 Tax=Neoarthrinium moseri TaxID=1658444 RepID=A0A9P9WA11_9PEZI|nr:hypothetical protein JX265_012897 [Neoarthrinium moseri]